MNQTNFRIGFAVFAAGALLAGCGGDDDGGGILGGGDGGPGIGDVLGGAAAEVAKQCGIDVDCKGGGIAKGNASISGVASVDAFFQSVLNFQAKADNVSAGIDAQLAAIRSDFGIDAKANLATELKAQIDANLSGGLTVKAEPAKCAVDAHATLEAQAKCDASIDPGKASVQCKGSCELDANAEVKCDASAELQCEVTAPSVECKGECSGTCEVTLDAAAKCEGTCNGTCEGNCSAFSDKEGTQCAGSCDGMCKGSCKAVVEGSASCSGKCEGSCKTTAGDAKCEAGARASCKAKGDVMASCQGRCDGEFEPPKAKAECEASAKAEAKINVECTPPRVELSYNFKASVDASAKAKFEAGLKNLEVRLPALLASIKKANLVADAGEGLAVDAKGAVKGAVDAAGKAAASGDLKAVFGLKCAAGQLDDVEMALSDSSGALTDSLNAAGSVTSALGMK
jgi:hypothetical protein